MKKQAQKVYVAKPTLSELNDMLAYKNFEKMTPKERVKFIEKLDRRDAPFYDMEVENYT